LADRIPSEAATRLGRLGTVRCYADNIEGKLAVVLLNQQRGAGVAITNDRSWVDELQIPLGANSDATATSGPLLDVVVGYSDSTSSGSQFVSLDSLLQKSQTTPNEGTAAPVAFERVIDHWLVFTGLPGPGIGAWRERMERVCGAAIWESAPLTGFAVEFLRDDGGDPEDSVLVRQAADAIWLMARQPAVCPDRFPAEARFPPAVPNCGNVSVPSELCE
jgi:hypothetical protein